MLDPRLEIIDKRLEEVKTIVAVAGGKGGIGKSLVSATLALVLADSGYRTGLLDLDFSGPSSHIILGGAEAGPVEEKGIVPPLVSGVRFLSIIYYTGDKPSPLRGSDISNAIIELLAITRWGPLDYLIIDMPPGIGDTVLDAVRLIKRAKFLIVATSSKVVLETVGKTLGILRELNAPVIGLVENMKMNESAAVRDFSKSFRIPFLGEIKLDPSVEAALGNPAALLKTEFAQSLKKAIQSTPEFRGAKAH